MGTILNPNPPTVHSVPGLSAAVGRQVHLLPGVTGSGTDADPWVGWAAAVAASPPRATNVFAPGVFFSNEEVRISNNRVSLVGSGESSTIIRVADPRPFMACIRYRSADGSTMRGVRIRDLTIDGAGVTENGLILRDVNFSAFTDIAFVNATLWCLRTSRGICNKWRYRMEGESMTFKTQNGGWFGEAPVADRGDGQPGYPGETEPFNSDYYVTCSSWDTIEVNFLPGTGLKIRQCFSLEFQGGAVEGCGVNLDMDDTTMTCVFDGTDLELATGDPSFTQAQIDADPELGNNVNPGMKAWGIYVGGSSHSFRRVNWIGTNAKITGPGDHEFEFFFGSQPNLLRVDTVNPCHNRTSGSGPNRLPWIYPGAGKVYETIGNTTYAKGANIRTYASNNNGGVTGFQALGVGSRMSGLYQDADGMAYMLNAGDVSDDPSQAYLMQKFAIRFKNQEVWFGGVVHFAAINVLSAANQDAVVEARTPVAATGAGKVPAFQLFAEGSSVSYIVQSEGRTYFADTGGLNDYAPATLQAAFNFYLTTTRDVVFGRDVTFPRFVAIKSLGAGPAPSAVYGQLWMEGASLYFYSTNGVVYKVGGP